MPRPDQLEIWIDDTILTGSNSAFAPLVGDLISIKKQTYRVIARSFAIDHSDDWEQRTVRCAVTVEKVDR